MYCVPVGAFCHTHINLTTIVKDIFVLQLNSQNLFTMKIVFIAMTIQLSYKCNDAVIMYLLCTSQKYTPSVCLEHVDLQILCRK